MGTTLRCRYWPGPELALRGRHGAPGPTAEPRGQARSSRRATIVPTVAAEREGSGVLMPADKPPPSTPRTQRLELLPSSHPPAQPLPACRARPRKDRPQAHGPEARAARLRTLLVSLPPPRQRETELQSCSFLFWRKIKI